MHLNPYVASVEPIWKSTKYCKVNFFRLDQIANELSKKELIIPKWEKDQAFPSWEHCSESQVINYLGVVNSLNFCFTDFRTRQKFDVEYPEGSGKIWRGSYALSASITRALEEGFQLLNPYFLKDITEEKVKRIFRHKTTPIPMFQERVMNLRNIGYVLTKTGIYDFHALFEKSNFLAFADGDGIVDRLLSLFKAYSDEVCWEGWVLRFAKRAQLLVLVYHAIAHHSKDLFRTITDANKIGPIADYQVAKRLRGVGILEYSKKLSEIVDSGTVIRQGSLKELEIRGHTVYAMQELLFRINKLLPENKEISMQELDYAFWSSSVFPLIKDLPHHFTYTTAY